MKLALSPNSRRGRLACAVTCLFLFLSLQLFAAVPQLHNWIHSDSNDATHQCELTLLTQGQVDTVCNSGVVMMLVLVVGVVAVMVNDTIRSFDYTQLPPGRAPPVS